MNINTSTPGKLRMAMARLVSHHPLHAGILAQWELVQDEEVGSMGIGFRDRKFCLVYDPVFVESTPVSELGGVVHHIINHLLFEHVFHTPAAGEDKQARTIAEEVTANEWLKDPLPGNPHRLEAYPVLSPKQSTVTRYRLLHRMLSRRRRNAQRKSRTSKTRGRQGDDARVHTVDNHDLWRELKQDEEKTRAEARLEIASAWVSLSADDRAKVEARFVLTAERGRRKLGLGVKPGTEPTHVELTLRAGTARTSWQEVLRLSVGRVRKRRPVMGRVPRRFPSLVGVIPGKGRYTTKPRILAAIDTSGSMRDGQLADISEELGVMARHYEVVVVEFDTEIQTVYPYHPIKSVHGRGGTDFRPLFERMFLAHHDPDMVVVFTDGDGPSPSAPPRVPVIWGLVGGHDEYVEPVSWGQKIRISDQDDYV